MIIVEYDGRKHAEDDEQWQSDIYRREELDRRGWRLVIITATGIYVDRSGPSSGWPMRCATAVSRFPGGSSRAGAATFRVAETTLCS